MRNEFDLELARKSELLEQLVLTDVSGDYFSNLSRFQKKTRPLPVNAGVVADNREIFNSLFARCIDEVFRNTAEPESTQHDCGSITHIGNRLSRIAHNFIHLGASVLEDRFDLIKVPTLHRIQDTLKPFNKRLQLMR